MKIGEIVMTRWALVIGNLSTVQNDTTFMNMFLEAIESKGAGDSKRHSLDEIASIVHGFRFLCVEVC